MSILFKIVSRSYFFFDRAVLSYLPRPVRNGAFAIAVRVKGRIFPGRLSSDLTKLSDGRAESGADAVARSGTAKAAPDWLRAEIVAIRREVDPGFLLAGAPSPSPWQRSYPAGRKTGDAYFALAAELASHGRATHFVMVPWLKRGGADLVAIKTVHAILSGGGRPIVLSTEDTDSPWAARLPDGIPFVDVATHCLHLTPAQRRIVMARVLIQFAPDTLHVINSLLGWETIATYGKAVGNRTAAFFSLFCDDFIDTDGVPRGFAHHFVQRADAHIRGYVSDNASYLARISATYGIDRVKCHVAYVPTASVDRSPADYGSRRVAWAGRLDRQKRPDLLLAVARAMPDVAFDVYGAPLLHADHKVLKRLKAMPNVVMKGAFDGFDAIDPSRYGAFLYTSAWDGIPNVPLEVAMRRLPIVASDVGGVAEVVRSDTGWLVCPADDVEGYVRALSEALSATDEARRRADNARALVSTRHTEEAFARAMAGIPGYFRRSAATDAAAAAEPAEA